MNTAVFRLKVWKLLALAALTPGLVGLIFLYPIFAADPTTDFQHAHNISRSAERGLTAGQPVINSYSDTVAVLWTEALDNETIETTGGHLYLQSARETPGYWRPTTKIHTATISAATPDTPLLGLARDPVFIFEGVNLPTDTYKLHIVWSEGYYSQKLVNDLPLNDFVYPNIQYTACNVATDYNTCAAPTTITATQSSTAKFLNPTLAQDDQGNLHVVWVDAANNTLLYSRGQISNTTVTWSNGVTITTGANPQNPQLVFANRRLHLVWDDDANNEIEYRYDTTYTDTVFSADGAKTWATSNAGYGAYQNGNPGNPTMVAQALDGNIDLLFISFDIQQPGTDNFALTYVRSQNNGNSWTTPRDIPTQGQWPSTDHPSVSGQGATSGLKPSLFITRTGALTWGNLWLHALWHEEVQDPQSESGPVYQVFYSYRVITDSLAGNWFTPTNITNPAQGTGGGNPAPPRAPQGTGTRDSVSPGFTITNPDAGGLGKTHAIYLERASGTADWDAYYRGVVAGTIDPDYLNDTSVFVAAKTVDITAIATAATSIPPMPLVYTITLRNTGDQNAIGVSFTDTFNLPNLVDTFNAYENIGVLDDTDTTNKQITWTGNITAQTSLTVTVEIVTTAVPVPTTLLNRVDVWSIGSRGQPIFRRTAGTRISNYTVYMPVIMKQ